MADVVFTDYGMLQMEPGRHLQENQGRAGERRNNYWMREADYSQTATQGRTQSLRGSGKMITLMFPTLGRA